MVLPPWPHAPEVTEMHVYGGGRVLLRVFHHRKPCHLPSSLRIHGDVVVSHGRRSIGTHANSPAGWSIDSSFDDRAPFDHRVEVADPAVFRNYEACRDLIHRMLADGPVTGDYDLAPANWGAMITRKWTTPMRSAARLADLRETPCASTSTSTCRHCWYVWFSAIHRP